MNWPAIRSHSHQERQLFIHEYKTMLPGHAHTRHVTVLLDLALLSPTVTYGGQFDVDPYAATKNYSVSSSIKQSNARIIENFIPVGRDEG